MPNQVSPAQDCCSTCNDQTTTQVPGPQGPAGTNGTNGTNGIDAFTVTTAQFTQPAVGSNVSVAVVTSAWASIGQVVYVKNGGYYTVDGIADGTHLTLKNLGYTGNVAPTTNVALGSSVSPGGLKGADGSSGSTILNNATLDGAAHTGAKGDMIVDNGANNPAASLVVFNVGTNGKELTADSTQATGMAWKQNLPNSATDKAVARYNGASGTPVPLQTSKFIITDNGAAQASGSGGNARGTDSVDLQVVRANANQVASGANATIGGGKNNKASGATDSVFAGDTNTASGGSSFVGGGYNNSSTGYQSAVVGGDTNVVSSDQSFIGGGALNQASGESSTIAGGLSNVASGPYSAILGGTGAVADKYAQQAFASSPFSVAGDAQKSELIWRVITSDATAGVEMFLDGSLATMRATIATSFTWGFDIIVTARSAAGVCAVWSAKGGIQNNAGTVSLVAAVTPTMISDGTGGTWGIAANFQVAADNTNKTLKLSVTGVGATIIRWIAHARIVEVSL